MESVLQQTEGKVVMIGNHCNVSFKPYEDDKMANDDAEARSAWYGFTYVPFATINGRDIGPTSITASTINSEYAKEAYFEYDIQAHRLSDFNDSCKVTIKVTAQDMPSASNLVVMAAVIEHDVDYQKVYGVAAKNGLNEYSHVLRKYLTPLTGEPVSMSAAGDEQVLTYVYNRDQATEQYENLRVIAFVQDRSTKEVYGAFEMDSHPYDVEVSVIQPNGSDVQGISLTDNHLTCELTKSGVVGVQIQRLNGQVVYETRENLSAGRQQLSLPVEQLSSGVYITRVSGAVNQSVKLIVP